MFKSAQTIKCDVARSAFAATGKSIVWAVADTGIDGDHPHFKTHDTLDLRDGLKHRDFLRRLRHRRTGVQSRARRRGRARNPCRRHHRRRDASDRSAQDQDPAGCPDQRLASTTSRKVDDDHADPILGLAPECQIMSLKVLRKGDERPG